MTFVLTFGYLKKESSDRGEEMGMKENPHKKCSCSILRKALMAPKIVRQPDGNSPIISHFPVPAITAIVLYQIRTWAVHR